MRGPCAAPWPSGMFRRPPRNFRGRRRAASSGSSDEGTEPEPVVAPVAAPSSPPAAPGPGSEREAEPEEGEGGDPGSAAASPEGAGAAASAAAEGPRPAEESAGSPGDREESGKAATGRGPRLAGTGPARGGKVLLSFGSEEEREGKGFGGVPRLRRGPHRCRGGSRCPAGGSGRSSQAGSLGEQAAPPHPAHGLCVCVWGGSCPPARPSPGLVTRGATGHLYGSL